ncbi:MAG: mobile mystery protein A [Sedimentisphaerales bacterium]|nr:mobile mystery protein A [Sedimentisphaerales bacterium]
MNAKHIKLAREQLDATLQRFKPIAELTVPAKGWVRAIRDAMGMTGRQLAERLNVNQQRIARIEQDEKLGKVKLETLMKVAQALNCKFVYGFAPKDSLEQTVRRQAELAAKKQMSRSDQTMRLENQELSNKEKEKSLKDLSEEIVNTMPKTLWDENGRA